MFESPRSLRAICFDFICKNLLALCEVYAGDDDERTACMESSSNLPAIGINSANAASKLRFKRFIKDQHVVLPGKISEPLLTTISETMAFDDLTMTVFGSTNTRLKHVRIKDAVRLSIKGLMVLKQHDIVDLEVNRLRITIHDLITCLTDLSLKNLKSLSVANGNFTESSSVFAFSALSNLPALQTLNVSGTEFDSHDLEMVVENLLHLESLDISRTRVDDITPLKKCKDRWKTLVMRDLETSTYEKSQEVFQELNELRTLDISVERCGGRATKTKADDLLAAVDCMPHLTSLDISGEMAISWSNLSMFIKAHPRLSFLGLLQTDRLVYSMGSLINPGHPDYKPDLRVSGVANETQIIESLKRYSDRPTYLRDCLQRMSVLLEGNMGNRVDLIKLIIPIMQVHPKELNLQVEGVACLYHLVKEELTPQIHPSVLQQTVDVTLNAMASCSDNEILQARCLVIMKNDQILETATFDKYRFATLLHGLLRFSNGAFDAMCLEIFSKLSSTMSLLETSALGSSSFFMHNLLSFVRFKVSSKCADKIMGFVMSALRDLTNRSSQSCNIFLEQGGMEVYLEALKTFPEESRIKTSVLGLFNNIAEFSEFRQRLMRSEFMKMLPLLMDSEQIDVSYHAAGIAAYLLSDGPQTWTEDPSMPTKTQFLDQLAKTVVTWQTPEYEIIAYRSFIPFFPLLRSTEPYPVQLWAVWAIHHACNENPKTYCRILKSESGDEILKSLEKDGVSETQPYVRRLFRSILDTLELHPS